MTGSRIWQKCFFFVTRHLEGVKIIVLIYCSRWLHIYFCFWCSFTTAITNNTYIYICYYDRQFGRGLSPTGNKPLSLEYLADRLDTDDPLWGYTIRTRPEVDPIRQMQGFITLTTFTTWVRWFRWDSSAEISALDYFPKELPKTGRVRHIPSRCYFVYSFFLTWTYVLKGGRLFKWIS